MLAISSADFTIRSVSTTPGSGSSTHRAGACDFRNSYCSYPSRDFSNPSFRNFFRAISAITSGRIGPVLTLTRQLTSAAAAMRYRGSVKNVASPEEASTSSPLLPVYPVR